MLVSCCLLCNYYLTLQRSQPLANTFKHTCTHVSEPWFSRADRAAHYLKSLALVTVWLGLSLLPSLPTTSRGLPQLKHCLVGPLLPLFSLFPSLLCFLHPPPLLFLSSIAVCFCSSFSDICTRTYTLIHTTYVSPSPYDRYILTNRICPSMAFPLYSEPSHVVSLPASFPCSLLCSQGVLIQMESKLQSKEVLDC